MGNSNSQIDFEYKVACIDFQPLEKARLPLLGEVMQMKNLKTDQIVLMNQKNIIDPDHVNKEINDYMTLVSLRHPNLAKVFGFAGSDIKVKTNTKPKLYIYFEQLSGNLQHVFSLRRNPVVQQKTPDQKPPKAEFLAENELLNIVGQLLGVFEFLQQHNTNHGDIKPESCFIGEANRIKVAIPWLVHEEPSSFRLAQEGDQSCLLTPVALEAIKKKQNEPLQDRFRADVFSLGMVLLEAATLKKSSSIYDWNNYTMNLNSFSNRLLEVKNRYSNEVYELLRWMLRLEENQRPDFIQLKKHLVSLGKMDPHNVVEPTEVSLIHYSYLNYC